MSRWNRHNTRKKWTQCTSLLDDRKVYSVKSKYKIGRTIKYCSDRKHTNADVRLDWDAHQLTNSSQNYAAYRTRYARKYRRVPKDTQPLSHKRWCAYFRYRTIWEMW